MTNAEDHRASCSGKVSRYAYSDTFSLHGKTKAKRLIHLNNKMVVEI